MDTIGFNLKNEYEQIRVNTIHDVMVRFIVLIFFTSIPSIVFSTYSGQQKIYILTFFSLLSGISLVIVLLTKYLRFKSLTRFRVYLAISLLYLILINFSAQGKYMTTTNSAVMVLIIVMFLSLSKKLLMIQGIITILISLVNGYLAIGKTVEIGSGYIFNLVGMIFLACFALYKGNEMYHKFEALYIDQLLSLNEMNLELTALNQEYIATEEELRYQYDEISRLNKDFINLNDFLSALLRVTEDGFLTYNLLTKEAKLYNRMTSLMGIETFEITEGIPNFYHNIIERDQQTFKDLWERLLNNEIHYGKIEIAYQHREKTYDLRLALLISHSKLGEKVLVVSMKDISKQKKSERELLFQVDHDLLTNAYNLDGFIKRLHLDLETYQNRDYYIVLLNIDNFKYINNSFGYEVGNKILIEIVDIIRSFKAVKDDIGRTNGDTIVFKVSTEESLEELLLNLNQSLSNVKLNNVIYKVPVSIGVTDTRNRIPAIDMVRNAETAMYKVKEKGKGGIAFHDTAYQELLEKKYRIFSKIKDGIEKREFYNVYQPIVNTDSQEVVGFETLVRWRSDELGVVFPNEFIEVAEQTGQIIDLGYFIIEEALIFLSKVVAINSKLTVSINISTKQLFDIGFVRKLEALIAKYSISVSNVALEVTESVYIENQESARSVLNALQNMGITIYLDDFGTGYSSLSYLDNLPINKLKIDRTFVNSIQEKESSNALLIGIINLAKSLGFDTVAEGVETAQQLKFLKIYECDYIQGYYFDKPLEEVDALKRLNFVYKK